MAKLLGQLHLGLLLKYTPFGVFFSAGYKIALELNFFYEKDSAAPRTCVNQFFGVFPGFSGFKCKP